MCTVEKTLDKNSGESMGVGWQSCDLQCVSADFGARGSPCTAVGSLTSEISPIYLAILQQKAVLEFALESASI